MKKVSGILKSGGKFNGYLIESVSDLLDYFKSVVNPEIKQGFIDYIHCLNVDEELSKSTLFNSVVKSADYKLINIDRQLEDRFMTLLKYILKGDLIVINSYGGWNTTDCYNELNALESVL